MFGRPKKHKRTLPQFINSDWASGYKRSNKSSDEKVYEELSANNINEAISGKSTKESICSEDLPNQYNIKLELKTAKEKIRNLEEKIQILVQEKKKSSDNEKKLKNNIYDADLELKHLHDINSIPIISEDILNIKKKISDRTQKCKKRKFYLDKLRENIIEKTKEINEKEFALNSLKQRFKNLNTDFLKKNSFKSLDISTLKISLDVMQFKLEDRCSKNSLSEINLSDLNEFLIINTKQLKVFSKRNYLKKIDQCKETSIEYEQKITELSINYEENKGKIMQSYRKVKEELQKVSKKNHEDQLAIFKLKSDVKKKQHLDIIKESSKKIPEIVSEEKLKESRDYLKVIYI
jgi:hypothetical protein